MTVFNENSHKLEATYQRESTVKLFEFDVQLIKPTEKLNPIRKVTSGSLTWNMSIILHLEVYVDNAYY